MEYGICLKEVTKFSLPKDVKIILLNTWIENLQNSELNYIIM
jgi:hypothetical protein